MTQGLRFVIAPVFLLTVIAYYVQSQFFVNSDVLYLVNTSYLFFHGGVYGQQILETNPPMILYLSAPIWWVAKLTAIDVQVIVKLYMFALALLSIGLCYSLLVKIIKPEDASMRYALLYTILFIFLFLPGDEFGQREHLLLMMFLPYVFAVVLALRKQTLSLWLAIWMGVMAGLSIGMKPFFLFPLILLECYLIYCQRRVLLRVESVVCASVLLCYLGTVFIFSPEYIHTMLPWVSRWYFAPRQQAWLSMLTETPVMYGLFALTCGSWFFVEKKYADLMKVLLFALSGFILAFLVTRSAWYYHVFPAFGLSCLVVTLFIVDKIKLNNMASAVILLFFFIIPLVCCYSNISESINKKRQGDLPQLISYVNSYFTASANRSVYCFSVGTTGDCYPLINITHSQYDGRSSFFWWLPGVVMTDLTSRNQTARPWLVQDKRYFIDNIAKELDQFNVGLVIINTADIKFTFGEKFNFIKYLSTNEKFKKTWNNYHYLTQVGVYELYERTSRSGIS